MHQPSQGSFGKRGQVKVTPQHNLVPEPLPQGGLLASNNGMLKWAGGAVAALFLLGLIGGGTGGGGLLAGILGGMMGHKLATSMRGAPTAAQTAPAAPARATQSTTVQRGGFGSTASSGSGFFSGS